MSDFLNQIMALPTVIYTSLLLLALLYWVFVIAGAVDIDMFDGAADAAADGLLDGAAEGTAEAVGHAAEGLGHSAEGLGHGIDLLALVGLRNVPFTLSFSMIVLISWCACVLGMQHAAPLLNTFLPSWLSSAVVGLGSLAISMPAAGITTRPLAPLFKTHKAAHRRDLVGKTCRVETGSVDKSFGQATIEEDGGWMKVEVRTRKGGTIQRGDEVLIVAYDPVHEAFTVEALGAAPTADAATLKRRAPQDEAT